MKKSFQVILLITTTALIGACDEDTSRKRVSAQHMNRGVIQVHNPYESYPLDRQYWFSDDRFDYEMVNLVGCKLFPSLGEVCTDEAYARKYGIAESNQNQPERRPKQLRQWRQQQPPQVHPWQQRGKTLNVGF